MAQTVLGWEIAWELLLLLDAAKWQVDNVKIEVVYLIVSVYCKALARVQTKSVMHFKAL